MHNMHGRVPGILGGLAAAAKALDVSAKDLAWMVRDVPQAIIRGAEVRIPASVAQSG
jgi:hypothetical protein